MPEPQFQNILIAVHGIGAQSRNSTVRSVATRLADSPTMTGTGQPGFAPQPLGYFYTDLEHAVKVSPLDNLANLSGTLRETGFAEVFWADIPQEVVQEKRTLEETKAWARTVMARARFLFHRAQEETERRRQTKAPEDQRKGDLTSLIAPDFSLASEVLEEIVDTVYVLENLAWIAEKAGLLKFNLRRVLEEYLGDVQIFTEFSLHRRDILGRLHRALEQIHRDHPEATLHLVAHSEGSVVAFLGLVHAMSRRRYVPAGVAAQVGSSDPAPAEKARRVDETETPSWLKKIRGFMTIGAPIDKHLLLWDRLWEDIDLSRSASVLPKRQIRWRNYYDLGDPIGFKLETARRWLEMQEDEVFEFCNCADCRHDLGFTRYLLPGKAHNDYWDDSEVFEHFVKAAFAKGGGVPAVEPRNRKLAALISPVLPYVLSALLLWLGTFLIYKAVNKFIYPDVDPLERYVRFMVGGVPPSSNDGSRWQLLLDTLGLAGLVAGSTIAARLPRLALAQHWRALFFFLLGCLSYCGIMPEARKTIGIFFEDWPGHEALPAAFGWETIGVLLLAVLVTAGGLLVTTKPRRKGLAGAIERSNRIFLKGARPLIVFGALAVTLVVSAELQWSHRHRHADEETKAMQQVRPTVTPAEQEQQEKLRQLSDSLLVPRPFWPVGVAGAAFLYLWWLATLIFDLSFVWNRYIRGGVALQRLRDWSELGREGLAEEGGQRLPPSSAHGESELPRRNCPFHEQRLQEQRAAAAARN